MRIDFQPRKLRSNRLYQGIRRVRKLSSELSGRTLNEFRQQLAERLLSRKRYCDLCAKGRERAS